MKLENLERAKIIQEHLNLINKIIEQFRKEKKIDRENFGRWWIQELGKDKSQRLINLIIEFRNEYLEEIDKL